MTSKRWSELDRPPLNQTALRKALLGEDSLWTALEVVESIGSTNAELADRARKGTAAPGSVLIAEEQTAGKGRLDRAWTAPPRSGLFFSVLFRPEPPPERWGWIPLLAGVATANAVARTAGVDTGLKWPNDVLTTGKGGERKIGGILAERVDAESVVLGIGLNVTLREDELPVPTAGSLALAGARGTDRDPLLRAVLRAVADWYGRWTAVNGDPTATATSPAATGQATGTALLDAYAAGCVTLGRAVRATLPGGGTGSGGDSSGGTSSGEAAKSNGEALVGEAVAVDGDGRLVIATEQGVQRPVAAGDIVHLRPATEE
ncbi:biotin--[acetyl-CoA-carboxylase] ligase [Streptomyces spirodelae]|uniref:biotin--[biotin carboxyl-carrier protein] ligase n=1 Tax=Streptomyces spirodelae TaxID=2812904 RepID=A0ABS3X3Q6_9ACTN|nr:biotin--[acetyl-CoA-carboxylase] ligase [Streptomyces spirodelae]MBO8189963.1 biotin--[acetyl-CoA-carboxylase] ligase [Streptomyces spirodelae]